MRVTAGILMIMIGFSSLSIAGTVTEQTAKIVGFEAAVETTGRWVFLLVFLSLVLTIGGGISTFRRKPWWWALSGAICSIVIGFSMFLYGIIGYIFLLIGILALIFVIKRKGEFQ